MIPQYIMDTLGQLFLIGLGLAMLIVVFSFIVYLITS